jgi:hypothetical protein
VYYALIINSCYTWGCNVTRPYFNEFSYSIINSFLVDVREEWGVASTLGPWNCERSEQIWLCGPEIDEELLPWGLREIQEVTPLTFGCHRAVAPARSLKEIFSLLPQFSDPLLSRLDGKGSWSEIRPTFPRGSQAGLDDTLSKASHPAPLDAHAIHM